MSAKPAPGLSALLAAFVPLAWLLPNHYPPWMSAWPEGLAMALLAAAALAVRTPLRLPGPVAAFGALAAASVLLQWAGGQVFFGGDAVVVLLYLAAFVLSVVVGGTLDTRARFAALDLVAAGLVAGALACTGLALAQWLRPGGDGTWLMVLPPGTRPYANLGQPNLLCSALFMGVCALALLHERGHLGRAVLAFAWGLLCFGLVMTGTRTGLLQLVLLPLLAAAFARRLPLRTGVGLAALPLGFAALAWWAWPLANDTLLLSAARSLSEQMEPGVRLPYWRAMLHAVAEQPWLGYGWQQVSVALWQVALDGPPVRRAFEQSHNLVLDLVLWAGVPLGLLLTGLLAAALLQPLRHLLRRPAAEREAAALWAMALVFGLVLHAMLEYPLQFAYLLVPVGLMLGAAGAMARPPERRRPAWRIAGLAFGLLVVFVGRDVLEAEQNQRTLLFELARVGTLRVESAPPDLALLSQLESFLTFVRTEPRPGMPDAEIEAMRRVALRFPYAPSFSRYAQALALNGREADARRTLQALCAMHLAHRCQAEQERWAAARERQPRLPPWP